MTEKSNLMRMAERASASFDALHPAKQYYLWRVTAGVAAGNIEIGDVVYCDNDGKFYRTGGKRNGNI